MMDALSNLHFLRPYWFIGIPLIGLLSVLLYRRQFNRGSWVNVCDANLLPFLIDAMATNKRRIWPYLVSLLIAVLVMLSLAGPVWKKLPQPLYRDETALIILLDLSRSMDATDLSPSRLVRARYKVLDILAKRRQGVTALVVYSQDAFVVSPLTEDNKTIANMVTSLSTDLMPSQGSNPEMAFDLSLDLLHQSGISSGDLLLITDGMPESSVNATKKIAERGHRISILAIGTEQGAPIKLSNGTYLKDSRGNVVIPKLDYNTLVKAAHQGGGRISRIAADDKDIDYLIAGINRAMDFNVGRRDQHRTELNSDVWREEGPWLLLLVAPFIALYFRKGLLLAALCCILPIGNDAYAFEWSSLWKTQDQKALQAFNEQSYKDAANEFTDPQWRAAAQYRNGDYDAALQSLQGLDTPEALYNQANALAKLGRIEEAIVNYDKVLAKQPGHEDASYNRKLLEDALKKQQQEQQNQQGQNGQQQDQQQKDQSQGQQQQQKQGDEKNSADNTQGQSQNQQGNDGKPSDSAKEQAQQSSKSDGSDESERASQTAEEKNQSASVDPAEQKSSDHEQQIKITDDAEQKDKAKQDKMSEQEQQQAMAREQWLRRIPDDPGGLLRRKFQYQWQRRGPLKSQEGNPW